MKRWRLFVMPLIVAAVGVGVWAATRPAVQIRPPETTEPSVSPPKIDAPKAESLEKILETNPVRFLEMSLEKYDREIQGYSHRLHKHERIHHNPELRKAEVCDVCFRENPFSVYMKWVEGADKAFAVLYLKDEDPKHLAVRPRLPFDIKGPLFTKAIDDPQAKNSGRFSIAQFGFKQSTQRSLASMKRAQERGTLHVKYEGIVPVEKLKGEKCYKFVRTPYDPHEEDGLNELTLYYDLDHWLQVGAVLKDDKGELLGEYFFTDRKINPKFDAKQFTRDAL